MNPARIRLVKHLLEVTKHKPIERQLREKWLAELAQYRLTIQDSNDAAQNDSIGTKIQEDLSR